MRTTILASIISFVVATCAQTTSFSAGGGVTYAVNVDSTGSDLFMQIKGPSTMTWIGLGQGSAMKGSNIFVIYSDAAGTNVTLSPRLGTGESTPQASTSQKVTLLSGSGITGGNMIANIKCTNCASWSGGTMDFTSTKANFIYGYKAGSALKTNSVSAPITQHDSFDSFTLNLASATGGDSTTNPFTSASTPTSTNTTTNPSTSSSDSSSAGNSSSGGVSSSQKVVSNATIAHGIMGVVAFVFLFPFGSLSIRILNFSGTLWVHVGMQIMGYLVALAVLETGVWIAVNNGQLGLTHPLIGIVVVVGLFFQPFSGLAHHLTFKKRVASGVRGGPNAFTYPHIAWGRAFITLGMVNGGLGLQLTGASMTLEIVYWAVAGVIWLTWMVVATLAMVKKRRAETGGNEKDRPIIRRVSMASDDVRNFSRLRDGEVRRPGQAFQMKDY